LFCSFALAHSLKKNNVFRRRGGVPQVAKRRGGERHGKENYFFSDLLHYCTSGGKSLFPYFLPCPALSRGENVVKEKPPIKKPVRFFWCPIFGENAPPQKAPQPPKKTEPSELKKRCSGKKIPIKNNSRRRQLKRNPRGAGERKAE
jgi:hypothetical protein